MSTGAMPAGFRIRPVETEEDIRAFVDLNQAFTGEGPICDRLIRHRPGGARRDFLLVETEDGKAVSTTCQLWWDLVVEGVALKTLMLEMVVTDPGYRRHGLVRAQINHFHRVAVERGADLCIIQGIPYYYRQYGYGYALDHTRSIRVERPPAPSPADTGYRLRPAGPADYPALAELYRAEMGRQALWVRRDAAGWGYLAEHARIPVEVMVPAQGGAPVGYLCRWSGETGVSVSESGVARPEYAATLLALAAEGNAISAGGNPAHPVYSALRTLGGTATVAQQWLLRLPDPARLLRALAPVLARRLERVGHGGLDTTLVLNFFKQALRLRIEGGALAAVEDAGFVDTSLGSKDGGDLAIAPEAFVRLVFGYRDLEQIRDAWPDTLVRASSRALVETLFPVMSSWVLMPY